MADKDKMSVADILAAARKSDGGESSAPAAEETAPAEQESSSSQAEAPQEAAPQEAAAPVKPATGKDGGRPSVAEMLAMARSGKGGGAAEKPKAAAKPKAKPAAKAKAPASKAQPASGGGEPRDTASILAAARGATKTGPMSKSEAAAKAKSDPAGKPKITAPPMPEKPAYAMPPKPAASKAVKGKKQDPGPETRRGFLNLGWSMLSLFGAVWSLMLLRFLFPNVLREPPSKFKVGFPDAFPTDQVQTKYKAQYGVWVVNTEYQGERQIFALKTVCTHLGCTPSWLEAEQKYKCPCHGSGFYKDGINFEGPAPRPLERYAIRVADDGQIEIDKSRTFQEEMGQWADAACYIPV